MNFSYLIEDFRALLKFRKKKRVIFFAFCREMEYNRGQNVIASGRHTNYEKI